MGSSKRIILGFKARVLARAARFFIPPESSEGYLYLASSKFTALRSSSTFFSISFWDNLKCSFKGKATFSATVIESKSAPS